MIWPRYEIKKKEAIKERKIEIKQNRMGERLMINYIFPIVYLISSTMMHPLSLR